MLQRSMFWLLMDFLARLYRLIGHVLFEFTHASFQIRDHEIVPLRQQINRYG